MQWKTDLITFIVENAESIDFIFPGTYQLICLIVVTEVFWYT